jgi:Ca2+-transporting ATPase
VTYHTETIGAVCDELESDLERGLSQRQVEERQRTVGPNQIEDASTVRPWVLFVNQFRDFMVLVLLAATAISFALGETGDALTIVAIVVMNAILGFFQEYRAEQSVATLKALTAPMARVWRDGQLQEIPARELVPGDLIELEAGDRVPADARVVQATSLKTDEAALTGESTPVSKIPDPLGDPALPVAERTNLVFMGTTVARGRGRALVVATGMATEMGTIAHLIRDAMEDQTPLQRRLEHLGKVLVMLSVAIVAVVVLTGLARGEPLYEMFLTGVSLAVAAIPEGLPAIVTVALALGVQRMIRAHAIVRRLPAVETLGCTTVICSDKTGTLTKNRMTVTEVWASGQQARRPVTGTFAWPAGTEPVLQAAAICTNAFLASERPSDEELGGQGDPTEIALLQAAVHGGLKPSELKRDYVRLGEIPFESERQRMTVFVTNPRNQPEIYTKGAVEVVLPLCRYVLWGEHSVGLDRAHRAAILTANETMAQNALRVLAVAYRPARTGEPEAQWERDLIFMGLVGMIDPPRPEAIQAVRLARQAGIQTVMITGDHPNTAQAVAHELGMLGSQDEVLTGRQLDALSDEELAQRVDRIRVYARVSPPHKLRVVKAWKQRGDVVAMTGDGVNDAPAVKEADIGIAMGLTGTDVTKEASAMILTDDNFATIVRAVAEGRAIYDNIRKFIRYLLSCNIGEVLVMFLAAFLGMPLPLLPIQILLVNLVTDGLPALALGVDPPSPDVMSRPPRPPKESVFARGLGTKIAFRGVLIGVSTLVVFGLALGPLTLGLRTARTMALATLVFSQLFHVFDVRSDKRSFWEVGIWSNPWAVVAVASSVAMLLSVIYLPSLAILFKVSPLSAQAWILVMLASTFVQFIATVRDAVIRPIRRMVRVVSRP